jgi:hypothetical protein
LLPGFPRMATSGSPLTKKPPLQRQGRLPNWCPRPESNRHDREVEGFSYHFDFRRQRMRCSWSGARLHHSLATLGARRLLSTPSHEPFDSGFGSALARTLARPGRSPNLTGFTFGVSSGGLKLLQVPCVYQFHHSGWLDSLPNPTGFAIRAERKKAPPRERVRLGMRWRPRSESNRRTRICSPLHDHSATRPSLAQREEYPRGA